MRFGMRSGRIALVSAGILCGLRCFGGGAVTNVSLDPPVWVIETNTTFRLTASVMPPDADNTNVSFSSAVPEIASVSEDGTVTGLANGTAAITVTTADGGHTATCEVTVYDGNHVPFYESFGAPDFARWIKKEGSPSRREGGAHAGKYSYEINEGKDILIKRFERPQYQVVTIWLYDSGVNGKNAIASATAVETESDYADGLGIHQGDNTYYKKEPWAASGVKRSKGWHELKWDYSSGTNCIKYIDGQEVMRKEGVHGFNRLWIGCSWGQGKDSGFLFDDIKVGNAPVIPRVDVSVSPAAIEMGEGGREKLTATYSVYPDMEFGLVWSSSDPAVATVSEDGFVTAEGVGDAEVSFSVTGAFASAAGVCRVHVVPAVPAVDRAGAFAWAGGDAGAWDLEAANAVWLPEGRTERAAFTNGATAILGSGAALTVAEGVAPGPVLVSSDEDVTLSGAKLGGGACVVKGGAGTLTVGGGGFSGRPVYVTNGVLKIGADAAPDALGGPDSAVTVSGGGTLDIAYAGEPALAARSRITHDKLIRIRGAGFNGQGALVNSGSRSAVTFSALRLTGDATVNGKNRMDLRTYSLEGGARPGRATLYGPTNATLTVTGENPGDGSLFGLVNADAAVGRIDVAPGGCLNVEGDTALDVPGGINLYGGSVLRLWDTPAGFGTELFFREGEGRLLGGNGNNRRDVASKITVAAGAAMVQDTDNVAQSNIRYSGGIGGEGAVKALSGGARFCGDLRTGLTVGGAAGKTPDVYLGDKATDMRGRATPRSVSLLSGEFALAPSCETVYSNLTVTGAGRFFPNYSDKKSPPAASILKEVTVNVTNLALGSANSCGYAVAESGTVVNVSQDFRQGYSGTDSHGSSFEIRKGASVTVGGMLFVGRNPNTAADAHELRVSGGELNVPNAPIIVAHDIYHGRLFLDGGVINAAGIDLRPHCASLNALRAGSEIFAMNGGVLNLGASGFWTMEGAATSDQICLGGGVLNSLADWGVKPHQRACFGCPDGRGGSFTLNLAGRTVTFPTALRGPSAVLLEGGGTFLADSGSQGSATGPWTVRNAGTNILANAAAFAGGLSLGEGVEAEIAIESPGRYVNLEVFWGGNGTLCNEFFNNPPQTGERFSPRIRDLLVPGGKPAQTALAYFGEFEVRAEDAGPFTFAVSCGDAAALFIDGQRVCGHDASGAVGTGTNTLQAGWHAFRLTAKNAAAGGGVINAAWKAAGMAAGWKKGAEQPPSEDPAAFTPFDTDRLPMRPAAASAAVRHRKISGLSGASAANGWDTRTDFTSSAVKNGMQDIHNKDWGEGKGALNEFEGLFLVEAGRAGEWTFSGKYDDRIGLWIDGDPVFKTTGYQETKSGTVALTTGFHRFRVRVLDYGGAIANGGNPVLTAQVNGAAAVPFDERSFSLAPVRYGSIDGALELAAGARLSNRAETPCRVSGILRGTGALKGSFGLDGAVWEVSCAADSRQAAAVVFEEPFADALADAGKIRVAFDAAPLRGRYVISPALGLPADPDALADKVEVSVPGGTDDRIVPQIDGNGNLVLVDLDLIGTVIIIR